MAHWIMHKTVIKEGCEEQAVKGWAFAAESMKDEPGLLFWKTFKCSEEERTYYVLECFSDMEAIDFHVAQPYTQKAVEMFDGIIEGHNAVDGADDLKGVANFLELAVDGK